MAGDQGGQPGAIAALRPVDVSSTGGPPSGTRADEVFRSRGFRRPRRGCDATWPTRRAESPHGARRAAVRQKSAPSLEALSAAVPPRGSVDLVEGLEILARNARSVRREDKPTTSRTSLPLRRILDREPRLAGLMADTELPRPGVALLDRLGPRVARITARVAQDRPDGPAAAPVRVARLAELAAAAAARSPASTPVGHTGRMTGSATPAGSRAPESCR